MRADVGGVSALTPTAERLGRLVEAQTGIPARHLGDVVAAQRDEAQARAMRLEDELVRVKREHARRLHALARELERVRGEQR